VNRLYLPLILEQLVSEVSLPPITLIRAVQLLPEGQRIPLQKVSYPDDDDKAEK